MALLNCGQAIPVGRHQDLFCPSPPLARPGCESGPPVTLLRFSLFLQFICHGLRLWDRYRLRHLPQVPFTWRHFLLGHLADLRGRLPFLQYTRWAKEHGGLYLIFHGKTPVVVITGKPERLRLAPV